MAQAEGRNGPSASGFDARRLEAYLRSVIPGLSAPMRVERVAGGQSNPTFFLDFGAVRLVLRKQPPGVLLPSAHAVDREYRVMRALAGTEVPVPATLLFCEDRDIVGTPFYVMRRVEGRVFHDCRLEAVPAAHRRDMYRAAAAALGKLHRIDPDRAGLGDFGRRSGYFTRQIGLWSRQWSLSHNRRDANIEALMEWLPRNVPADAPAVISHGDYRIGNLLFDVGKREVAAILDWELSTLGHPLADLAHFCIAWHTGPDEYGGIRGLDPPASRLPEQAEFEGWYYAGCTHGLSLKPFHLAFALFRYAVIFEGIAARARAGNAADAEASHVGGLARVLARRAVQVLERDSPEPAGG